MNCTAGAYGREASVETGTAYWVLDKEAGPADIAYPMGDASGDIRDVHGLKLLPKGPTFWFPNAGDGAEPLVLLRVGAGAHNDIVVHGKHVTDTHCVIEVTASQVKVRDFEHPGETLVNEVAIADGSAVLHRHNRLRLGKRGKVQLVACGPNGEATPDLVARDFPGMLRGAHEVYQAGTKISAVLGIPERTVYSKLKKLGIVAVVVLGGLYWRASVSGPGASSMDSAPPVLAPAAAGAPDKAPVSESGTSETRVTEPSETDATRKARPTVDTDTSKRAANSERRKPSKPRRVRRKRDVTERKMRGIQAAETKPVESSVGSYDATWQFPGVSHDVPLPGEQFEQEGKP